MLGREGANYLLAVVELGSTFGVCFVDTSTGRLFLGQFEDDRQATRLRTLLAQIHPTEVLYPYGSSKRTQEILRSELMAGTVRTMMKLEEFWDTPKLAARLKSKAYFNTRTDIGDKVDGLPAVLATVFANKDELALTAFGGCLCYLSRLLLDVEVLSLGRICHYDPSASSLSDFLVLDGQTLSNLEILTNSEGGTEGTLLKHLDHCVTAFGKRLLREWVSRPLGRAAAIEERLDAVEALMQHEGALESFRKALRQIPDLERHLARVHANGIKNSIAIMYENVNARKLDLFFKTLKGFEDVAEVVANLAKAGLPSARISALTTPGVKFPDLSEPLQFFKKAFDRKECKEAGFIKPFKGVDDDYDAADG